MAGYDVFAPHLPDRAAQLNHERFGRLFTGRLLIVASDPHCAQDPPIKSPLGPMRSLANTVRKLEFQLLQPRYSTRYSILIPRRATSSKNASAGTSRSWSTAPRLPIAPEHIICRTIDAGNAVVRIMALISVFAS